MSNMNCKCRRDLNSLIEALENGDVPLEILIKAMKMSEVEDGWVAEDFIEELVDNVDRL